MCIDDMNSEETDYDENDILATRPEDCPVIPLRQAVVLALADQPLLFRLEFVRNMIAASGGTGDIPCDQNLTIAAEVLIEAIGILRTYPKVAMASCEAEPAPVRPRRKKNKPNPPVAKNH